MAVNNRDVSQDQVSQEINLADYLDRTPTEQEAQDFIDLAKERIIERTQGGKNVDGRKFIQYSKEYAQEKGVGRGQVDLTLFGDMLESINGEQDRERVVIKIEGKEATKAFAHITGYEGHPTIPNGKYKRDFFGLTDKEAKSIAERVKQFDRLSELRQTIDIASIIERIGIQLGEDNNNGP